jgi:hypothetical protein
VLVELEVGAVQEQVVETDARQVTPGEGVELVLHLLADPRHRRLGQRRFVAEHLFQGGFDVTVRQPAHPGRDDQGLEGVGAGHPHPEQLRAELLVGAAELGPLELHRAHGGLDRGGRLPTVAVTGGTLLGPRLVAPATQEGVDLGFDGLLHEQADGEPADVLQDAGQVLVGCEQLVYLCAEALGG